MQQGKGQNDMDKKTMPESGISPEEESLLKQYISAFCKLYGITPVYRAWRIIKKQNPELDISEEQFLAFLDGLDEDEMYCLVLGEEEIYGGIKGSTPPRKREIISQYLYLSDDFESYEELKAQQADKPFYVPEKDELLKYADDTYGFESIRNTRECQTLRAFLVQVLKIKNADEVLDELQAVACIDGDIPFCAEDTLHTVGKMKKFPSEETEEKYYRLCADMCNNVRMHAHRGHTPNEIAILCNDEELRL